MAINPKIMVNLLNCNKITNPIKSKNIKKIRALIIEIWPSAIGLFLVLLTLSSKFRSAKSLIIQPAERMMKDPTKKKIITFNISILKTTLCMEKIIPNRLDKNNNIKPIGW
jgi:hypothetical protein